MYTGVKSWRNFVPDYPLCFELEPSIESLKRDLEFAKITGIFARAGLH